MKKLLLLPAYFFVFWLLLPAGLFWAGFYLDGFLSTDIFNCQTKKTAGILLTLVAGGLFLLAVFQFRYYGKAWPVSAAPPQRLVRQGLFAWWRHPIYLFFDLTIVGAGLWVGSAGFLFIVFPVFILAEYFYLRREEKRLERRMPVQYPYYRRTTGLLLPRFYQVMRWVFFVVFKLLFTYEKKTPAPLPEPPFFIVARHCNYLDPFLIGSALSVPISFITTFEMFRNMPSSFLFSKLYCIPKRRFRADIRCVRQVKKRLREGGVIGIFPEGERRWTGTPGPFKQEVLKLLHQHAAVPVVPVRLSGNYHARPRWAGGVRRAKITVNVGAPIQLDINQHPGSIENLLNNALKAENTRSRCLSKNIAGGLPRLIYRCPVCFRFEKWQQTASNAVTCRACGTVFLLYADYTLAYKIGTDIKKQTLAQVYDQIRTKELDVKHSIAIDLGNLHLNTGETVLAEIKDVLLSESVGRTFRRPGCACLLVTNQRVLSRDGRVRVPVSAIRSVTVEGHSKLQLYLPETDQLFQIFIKNNSVLRWSDFFVCLLKHEYHIIPNQF